MAAWIWSSSFHRTGDVKMEGGRMGSGSSGVGSGWCRQERASALMFLLPGLVRDLETEPGEEQGPSGLPGVETLGFLEIL